MALVVWRTQRERWDGADSRRHWPLVGLICSGPPLLNMGLKATAAWFHSLYLLKSHFMNTPGWRKHTQLKITWNEFKPESAHLAVANTAISCSFLPSSPSASLAKFNQCSGVFLYCEDEATTLFSNQSGLIAGADVLLKHSRVMLMSCKASLPNLSSPDRVGEMGCTIWLPGLNCSHVIMVCMDGPGGQHQNHHKY